MLGFSSLTTGGPDVGNPVGLAYAGITTGNVAAFPYFGFLNRVKIFMFHTWRTYLPGQLY